MRKIENWENVNENSEFAKLAAGPQICKILAVDDIAEKEYLKIYFDIVGTDAKIGMKPETVAKIKSDYPNINELVGEFARQAEKFKLEWPRTGYDTRSYKDTAAGFFKAFITAVEKSNKGYQWNWDEKSLIGKYVVVNFGEEEYLDKDGNVAVSIKAQEFRSIEAFVKNEIKLIPIKKLTTSHPTSPVPSTVAPADIDLPW